MCSLPLASSNSIVWSVSFSVSLPLARIPFNSLRVNPNQQSIVDAGSFALWRRSTAPSEHSRPLHNHLTAVESKGSGCPDAGVDCSPHTSAVLVWCKCVSAMRRMEEQLFCLHSPVLGSEGRKFVFTYPSGFSSRLAGDPTISPRVQKVWPKKSWNQQKKWRQFRNSPANCELR